MKLKLKYFLSKQSLNIVGVIFLIYLAVYTIFKLYRSEFVLYNYVLLFLLGIIIGYKIALKAILYLNSKQNENQTNNNDI